MPPGRAGADVSSPALVRLVSNGSAGGTSVVIVQEDGTEVDVSNMVTRAIWSHEGRGLPTVFLELAPCCQIEAEGYRVHIAQPDPEG